MSIDHNHKSNVIYIVILTTSQKTFAAGRNGVKRLSSAFTHIVRDWRHLRSVLATLEGLIYARELYDCNNGQARRMVVPCPRVT